MRAVDAFCQYFRVLRASTPDQRRQAYRIRFEVYCREFGYEPLERFPDEQERDDYDEHAAHCLLIHGPADQAVGCVRIIHPRPGPAEPQLPFERFCHHALDPRICDLASLAPGSYGEISRLAVLPHYRRRRIDEHKPISIPEQQAAEDSGRTSYPLIAISLVLCSLATLIDHGLDHGFAMMEPRLARLLRVHGIVFQRMGNVIDYHGMRGPFRIASADMLDRLTPETRELMEVVQQQLRAGDGS